MSLYVNWLIEEGTVMDDISPLVRCLKDAGMPYAIVPKQSYKEESYQQFKDNDCVICLGSINFIRRIQRTKPWVPGGIANFKNFDCMTYYAYYYNYLMNKDFQVLPLGLVPEIIKTHKLDRNSLFIRPTSGAKNFAGQKLDYESLIKYQDQYGPPDLPVLLSPAKAVVNEYRVFCSENKVLGGTLYYDEDGEHEPRPLNADEFYLDKIVVDYCQAILESVAWKPDNLFTIDVGFTTDEPNTPRVVELSSFSSSGWYETKPENIIFSAAKVALEEWKDLNG